MRRVVPLVGAALVAGCTADHGIALELTLLADCPAAIDRVVLEVEATPPATIVDGGTSFERAGSDLFAGAGRSQRLLLLLPEATTRARVHVEARDATGRPIGDTTREFNFSGPALVRDEIQVPLSCPSGADGSVDLPLDGSLPDGVADLLPPPCGTAELMGGFISAPAIAAYDVATLTVEAWVHPTMWVGNSENIVSHWGRTDQGTGGYALYTTGMRPAFAVSCTGMNFFSMSSPNPIPLNDWSHLAAVFDTTTSRAWLFVNGTLAQMSAALPCNAPHANGAPLVLSYDDPVGGDAFFGYLDEVRLSSTVRYRLNFTPAARFTSDADTVALFHLDADTGSVGTTAADSSGNQNHATLTGLAALAEHCR